MDTVIIVGIFLAIGFIGLVCFVSYILQKYSKLQHELEAVKYGKQCDIIDELERYKKNKTSEIEIAINDLKIKQKQLEYDKLQLQKEINEKKEFNDNLRRIREDELNRLIEAEKTEKLEAVSKEVSEWTASAQEAATFAHKELETQLFDQTCQKQKELEDLEQEIIDFKARQASINQEILRRRAIEENGDFYRVQLPEVVSHDIHILNSIRSQLSKIDNFDKFIYDIYVKKSVDEMIKRVLEGGAPCGIYRITRLKTGETYIGKSTDIKSRWQQHAKSAFHCGTISHSILHTTMEKDGIENFQWEVIEEVPKSELSAREKFWIGIYGSKDYGLNEREG